MSRYASKINPILANKASKGIVPSQSSNIKMHHWIVAASAATTVRYAGGTSNASKSRSTFRASEVRERSGANRASQFSKYRE